MALLRAPADVQWELLVVDNGSTDATNAVLTRFARCLPLRGIEESSPGLSNARNKAVECARGDYIVWTDDDVLVDRDWLSAYYEAFRRQPRGVVFGGPIVPRLERPSPEWLVRVLPQISYVFAANDLGPSAHRLDVASGALPFGANFAVRASALRGRSFDTELGRGAGPLDMGGEDIELMRDILVSGGQGWWVPSARVEHVVSPDRQTIGYLRRYWRGHGAYLGRLEQRGRGEAPLGAGKLVRRAVRAELRYLSHRLMSPPEVWVEELKAASELRGRLAWQRARDRVA